MNRNRPRRPRLRSFARWLPVTLALMATGALATDPGRLFYTPAQRAQLETARSGGGQRAKAPSAAPASGPVQFDGIVVRSDGRTTTWINGEARRGDAGAANLKPGQVRAGNQVYEPYQVLAPETVRVVPNRVAP